MVVLDLGTRAAAEALAVEPDRARRVGDVEQRRLHPARDAVGADLAADAEQEPRPDRMQIGRVPGDLQLAHRAGRGRVREVEDIERVDLAERDHVAGVADQADGVDVLAAADATDPPDRAQAIPVGDELGDIALAFALLRAVGQPWRRGRARHPQHPLVLGHRPLAQHVAAHPAAGHVVGRPGVGDVEAVDLGVDLRAIGVGTVGPALGRDVERAGRGVHDLAVGEHGVDVDGGEAALEVDRQHREHPGAGEPRRPRDVTAADQLVAAARAADAVAHGDGGQQGAAVAALRDRGRCVARADQAGRRAGQPAAHVGALDGHRLGDAHRRRVGDVDHGDHRARLPGVRDVRGDHVGLDRPVPVAGADREQPIAGDEQLVAGDRSALAGPARKPHGAAQHGRWGAGVDRPQSGPVDAEDGRAGGLDDVRLVDSLLLDVGGRAAERLRRRPGFAALSAVAPEATPIPPTVTIASRWRRRYQRSRSQLPTGRRAGARSWSAAARWPGVLATSAIAAIASAPTTRARADNGRIRSLMP